MFMKPQLAETDGFSFIFCITLQLYIYTWLDRCTAQTVKWQPALIFFIKTIPSPSLTIKCDPIAACVSVLAQVFVFLPMNPGSTSVFGVQEGM